MKRKIFIFFIFIIIISIFILFLNLFFNNFNSFGNEVAAVKLYKELIDKASKNNIKESDEYISIDTSSLVDPLNGKQLSESSKNEILNYCKKYNSTVYSKNYIEIKEENINENGLKGLALILNLTKKEKNKIYMLVNHYRTNLGSGGNQYICTYEQNMWKITNGTVSWSS